MDARSVGLAFGVMVGLILCVVLFKFWNKDGKIKTKYDEMQERARGRAYKYSFWTLAGYEILMTSVAGLVGDIHMEPFIIHFTGILISAMVHAVYSVWNDAYVGLNTNSRRFMICMFVVGLINLFSGIMAIVSGTLVIDGVLMAPFANLLCAFMFIVVGAEIAIKDRIDNKDGED